MGQRINFNEPYYALRKRKALDMQISARLRLARKKGEYKLRSLSSSQDTHSPQTLCRAPSSEERRKATT